ncbi:MAG: hypothetical protein LBU47_01100, partial [Christensenellaceae bacterium]|nr:hypothetical protein [Christensenellaceae bacterium]
ETLVGINTRVKGEESLKEKILRRGLYKKHTYAETILDNMPDLIGLRVECRFLADEAALSEILLERFTEKAADGFYFAPGFPDVRLEMEEMQPQIQNNGQKIYKIDGFYGPLGEATRFELQIKALVHVFWAEVEHEIIYKNNSYMLMDSFMKQMLELAYQNLSQVDNQLYLIYSQIQRQGVTPDEGTREDALRALFAKTISDMFYVKMHKNLGFTLDFRRSCDILSRYLLARHEALNAEEGAGVTSLLSRIGRAAAEEIDFSSPLELEDELKSGIPFIDILAEHLTSQMNLDFEWNMLFRMLFTLEPGSNLEDFANLLAMLRKRLSDDGLYAPLFLSWPREAAEGFKQALLIHAAHQMAADGSVRIIYDETLEEIRGNIEKTAAAYASAPPPASFPRVTLWSPGAPA